MPPHRSSFLADDKCSELLNMGGCLLRNVYNWASMYKTSFWFVIKDSFGGMEELSSKNEKSSEEIIEDIRCVPRIGK